MANQHRRIHEDDYRRGGRRSWSDRAREEARPWLRGDEHWRQEPGQRDDWEERSFAGPGERSWRDQGDGSYERAARYRDGDRGYGYAGPDRDRGWSAREGDHGWSAREDRDNGRDYGRDAYGSEGRDEDQGRGRSEDWNAARMAASPDERYRQWRVNYGRGAHYERTPQFGDSHGRWGRQSFAGRGPKGYHRSDERIKEDISEQLMDDDDVDASEITVQVVQGEVTLTGTVEDRHQKRRAEDIVECISGVSDVTNSLRVGRQDSSADFSTSGQNLSGTHSSASPASGSSKATKPTNSAS